MDAYIYDCIHHEGIHTSFVCYDVIGVAVICLSVQMIVHNLYICAFWHDGNIWGASEHSVWEPFYDMYYSYMLLDDGTVDGEHLLLALN